MTDIEIIQTTPEETPAIQEFANEIEARRHLFQRKKKRNEMLVEVPEWAMKVLIRAISGAARSEYFTFSNETNANYQNTGELFKRLWFEQVRIGCLHPVTQQPILQPADRDEFMNDEDGAVIQALAEMVREISGLNAGSIDSIKKKWQPTAKSTATSNSQNDSTAHT